MTIIVDEQSYKFEIAHLYLVYLFLIILGQDDFPVEPQ